MLSDALNSFMDIVSYSVVFISVRIHQREPDDDHQFGHRRAEPLAGLLIAIFSTLLGANLIKDTFLSLFSPYQSRTFTPLAVGALLFSMAVKAFLAFAYRAEARRSRSTALYASFVDSRNDVVASAVALGGYWLGDPWDALAAGLIGLSILYSGVWVGLENLDYLMGKAPEASFFASIESEAMAVPGVLGLHDVRAHYVGDTVHVQVHIEVDGRLTTRESHAIATRVTRRLEALETVQSAFVHVDPVPLEEE